MPEARPYVVAFALSLLLGCSGDSDGVSREDCDRLRAHLIAIRMESVTADVEQHRAALEAAVDSSFVASCVERTTEAQLHCALAAHDHDALVNCAVPAAR